MADDGFVPQEDDGNDTSTGNPDNVVLLPTGAGYYSGAQAGIRNEAYTTTLAKAYYLRMPSSQVQDIERIWRKYGKDYGFRKPSSMWNAFVDASVNTGQTPFQIADAWAAANQSGAQKPPENNGPGGGPSYGPFRNTDVTLTSKSQAEGLVDQALQRYLGRDATDKERKKFLALLNEQQMDNPTVVEGATSAGGTSSVRSGGVDPAQVATDFAQSRKDYSEYQAATTYLDAFMDAIKNPTRMI